MYRIVVWIGLFISVASYGMEATSGSRTFVHPGIPLTKADLNRVKAHIKAGDYPWKQGFELLSEDGHSQLNYKMRGPFEEVGRNIGGTGKHLHRKEWMSDMQAVFNLARMWYFTGNGAYAQKAHDILLAWAKTQKSFTGYESNLDLGDYAFRFAGGADILRGTWPGWTKKDTEAVSHLFMDVYWNAAFNDGDALGPANKGALSMVAGLAIATFCDDEKKFNHCLELFRSAGPSGLQNTLPTGQVGESLRDQGHAYGEWFSLAMMAEIFWKQGVDVYSELNNRLLAVGEYHARYNLGVDTPFIPFGTTDYYYLDNHQPGTWPHGVLGYNLIHGAYAVRMGLRTPWIDTRCGELPFDDESFDFLKSADNSTASAPPRSPVPTPETVTRGVENCDLGHAKPADDAAFGNGVWTVHGAGRSMHTEGGDSCHFTYLPAAGNCAVSARVLSVGGKHNALAGVMIREALDPDATKAWVGINGDGAAEFRFSDDWTRLRGGRNWEKGTRRIPSPVYWVKAERIRDRIALYISPDGTSWACIGNAVFGKMGRAAYIGLVACSGGDNASSEARFDHVRMTGGDGDAAPEVPEAPLSLLASPAIGCVQLRWLTAAGADHYIVKRAASETGPYRPIATVAVSSHTDTNVVAGRTYFYKVCAENAAGTGDDSPGASATPRKPYVPQALVDGIYTITVKNSGMRLEIQKRSFGEGAAIVQGKADDSKYQQWGIRRVDGNQFQLVNVGSRKALDVKGNSKENGARIVQNSFSNKDAGQIWTMVDNGNGSFRILNTQSGKSLDVVHSSKDEGANLDLWSYKGAANQMFILKPIRIWKSTSDSGRDDGRIR